MSYMTEECYTAHPWMLAAKWHPNRVPSLHYVIGNPCSAITFQCAQWSKLMSHFYSGRTRLPTISFFFFSPSQLRDTICLRGNCNGCFRVSGLQNEGMFCAILFAFLLNPLICVGFISVLCVCMCVYFCIQLVCGTIRCLDYCVSLLCIRYGWIVAKIWEVLLQQLVFGGDSKDDAIAYFRITTVSRVCFLWLFSFLGCVCLSVFRLHFKDITALWSNFS